MDITSIMNRAKKAVVQTQDRKPAEDDLVPRRDYLKVIWPQDPDPFLVCLDRKKLGLLNKQFPGLVIYFPEELSEMAKFADDRKAVMGVHLVKKKFLRSWVIPPPPDRKE